MERYGILSNKGQEDDQPWKYNQRRSGVGLYSNGVIGGFSWPPRSYGCSFCKREFRSAQALGGHMNVHRRERARLRHYSPPWDHHTPPVTNANPNINYNKTTSIPNLNVVAPAGPVSPSSTLSSPVPVTKDCSTEDQVKFSLFGHNYTLLKAPVSFYGEAMNIRDLAVDEQNTMKLELAMGRCKDHHEDGLDLELRLGFS